jgi:tRNA A-37 threonylcarbamoyl transferase component Bud32
MLVKDRNPVEEARKSQIAHIHGAQSMFRLGLNGEPPFRKVSTRQLEIVQTGSAENPTEQEIFVGEILSTPNMWINSPQAQILKDDRTSLILKIQGPEEPIILKTYRKRKALDPLLNQWRYSRARHAFAAAHALSELGFSTPFAWGFSEFGNRLGWPQESHLVTSFLDQGQTLADFVSRAPAPLGPAAVQRMVRQLAEWVASLHASGVFHPDLKPVNILMDQPVPGNDFPEPPEFVLIDLDRLKIDDRPRRRTCIENLVQLHGSFQSTIPWKTRWAFWLHYSRCFSGKIIPDIAQFDSRTTHWLGKRKRW